MSSVHLPTISFRVINLRYSAPPQKKSSVIDGNVNAYMVLRGNGMAADRACAERGVLGLLFVSFSKEPSQQRVKRWGFGMDEALKDPVGREQFLKFLESEFSSENLR